MERVGQPIVVRVVGLPGNLQLTDGAARQGLRRRARGSGGRRFAGVRDGDAVGTRHRLSAAGLGGRGSASCVVTVMFLTTGGVFCGKIGQGDAIQDGGPA